MIVYFPLHENAFNGYSKLSVKFQTIPWHLVSSFEVLWVLRTSSAHLLPVPAIERYKWYQTVILSKTYRPSDSLWLHTVTYILSTMLLIDAYDRSRLIQVILKEIESSQK